MKHLSRSLSILVLLYGLVFAIGDMLLVKVGAPLALALAFPLVMVGIQYLLGPWIIQWIMDIEWVDEPRGLPVANWEFVNKLCAERGLKRPRIGVIHSGTPNAFSFGRTPRDARVVVTQGLLDVLTAEESNAVLAHEIGHVEHWDFLVMTFAAVVPLVLYQFYVITEKFNNLKAIAWTSYLCYIVSQFVVLSLNRTREYWADHYAGEVTGQPGQLSSALVKIAYGMVRVEGQYKEAMASKDKEAKSAWRRDRNLGGALALMGISNLKSGAALALGANPAEASAVMRWDLVNPWAKLYELNSTHPLTALRVRELNAQTVAMQKPIEYPLPQVSRKAWGMFPLEVFLWGAPFFAIGAMFLSASPSTLADFGIHLTSTMRPALLMMAGALWIVRCMYRYRSGFEPATIGRLLEDVDVSEMRPKAVRVKGTILGRGVPGVFWSPDLVLRDETGIIFLLYRQSIPLARWVFALEKAEEYIGREVVVEGWFRRGMTPYIEMSKLTAEGFQSHRLYSRWIQYAVSVIAIAVGWLWYAGQLF